MYHVLLVDDEPIFLEYMQQVIDWQQYGCRICACLEDGEDAIAYIAQNKPDIAFMDINMPKRSGIEVCEEVKRQGIGTELIITTAFDEFDFAYRAIKMGIADYLLKPFDEQELIAALLKVIEKINSRTNRTEPVKHAASRREKSKSDLLLERIDEYVLSHYDQSGLTIDQIAKALHFENSYLRRFYKRHTGMTISQRIDNVRIEKAKELLSGGNMLISEIAKACGYSDHYYFSKRFKQLCGCAPSEYRCDRQNEEKSSS